MKKRVIETLRSCGKVAFIYCAVAGSLWFTVVGFMMLNSIPLYIQVGNGTLLTLKGGEVVAWTYLMVGVAGIITLLAMSAGSLLEWAKAAKRKSETL